MFSRHLQDMPSRRLQDVFSVTSLRLPKCLEEILQDVLKTSRKTKNCYAEDVLKTPWRHVLKTSWNHVLMTPWRHVLKMSWKHVLKTLWRQTKYLPAKCVSDKSKCVCNKFLFHKSIFDNSKANTKYIKQNPSFQYSSYFLELKQHLYFKN